MMRRTELEQALDGLLGSWRAAGVSPNPGAAPEQLAQLASFLGFPVPSDVAALYRAANGLPQGESDQWWVSWWPIEQVVQNDPEERDGRIWIAFADHLIDSWRFCYSPRSDMTLTPVLCEGTDEGSDSIAMFLGRYVTAPDSFYLVAKPDNG
jgi:hypothetical protein